MSKEYVTKEKVIDELSRYGMTADGEAIINAIPADDVVEVRHGSWINERWEGLSSFSAECSLCGKRTLAYFHYSYCPNCGAKMDGGQDDV